ncbi:MAG: DUF91 domain-containing protein [Tolypothrix carrinoi HA7290-LM1]|jgi:RecB family endonuclease NucS|nr:DUF91 domain-containing protein [Tolypothrix carrinoi HA7290-LM1]
MNVNLRKTGFGWEFETEADLEDFVWANLQQLLGLTPLKRQHYVNGQFCDILALGDNQQLVVLELKKGEDRYIVQQLTRYFDALLEDKPFPEQVDYQKPIGLIAIQASFHRDNFIDRKYNHLPIQFFRYEVVADGEKLDLQLEDVESGKVIKIVITHQDRDSTEHIPSPPRVLLNRLDKFSVQQQEGILRIRRKILSFDKRMEEIPSGISIKYGNGNSRKSKLCAELCFDTKGFPLLFLWLGFKNGKSERIGRARLWTDWQANALIEGYVSSGIGAKITSYKNVMAKRIEKLNEIAKENGTYSSTFKYMRQYCKDRNRITRKLSNHEPLTYEDMKLMEVDHYGLDIYKFEKYEDLDKLIDLALETWLKRL